MLYTISPDGAIPAGPDAAGGGAKEARGGFAQVTAGLPAGMIAVRAAEGPVAPGELLVFAHPVTVAPAVVGRDGVVRARG